MPAGSSPCDPDRELPPSRHDRTVLFYGREAFDRIRAARVAVVGLGGVGGHAAVNLARSGIGALHLVDFDRVTATSLNRSAFAGPRDVARLKTEVLAEHLARTCPDTAVTTAEIFCNQQTLAQVVPVAAPLRPDLVIDAIDALNPKVGLLAWCRQHAVPVLTSLGAAGKRDIGQVRTGDIAASRVCPLARQVRLRLRRRGIDGGIPAIWSIEPTVAHRPLAARETAPAGEPPIDRGRERNVLASQMTLPGVFGYGLAAMALDLIAAGEGPRAAPAAPNGGPP